MVRRHHAIAFMAGAHVFPGGRVDERDRLADDRWCDGLKEARTNIPGVDADAAVSFHVAAVRELFEEAGVLLARVPSRGFVSLSRSDDHQRFAGYRADLNASRCSLQSIVTEEGLRVALDCLTHYAHWVTPPVDVKRFDTRFFITRVPPEQTPVHDDHEATDSVWITPDAALSAVGRRELILPPPTWATLRELQRFESVDDALCWARARTVYRREPRVILEADGVRRIVLPGDPEMPEPDPVPFETRFVLADGRWTPEPLA